MRSIVADASALVEYLLRSPGAEAPRSAIEAPDALLHVPALCDVEVASVLRRALLGRRLTEERCGEALRDYLDLPVARHGHALLLERVLALRSNFSAYDATYVALAEVLDARLLTADEALARAVRAHTAVALLPA